MASQSKLQHNKNFAELVRLCAPVELARAVAMNTYRYLIDGHCFSHGCTLICTGDVCGLWRRCEGMFEGQACTVTMRVLEARRLKDADSRPPMERICLALSRRGRAVQPAMHPTVDMLGAQTNRQCVSLCHVHVTEHSGRHGARCRYDRMVGGEGRKEGLLGRDLVGWQ